MTIILKGGPNSGWFSPPKGTHSGEKHISVGSGKSTKEAGKPINANEPYGTGKAYPESDVQAEASNKLAVEAMEKHMATSGQRPELKDTVVTDLSEDTGVCSLRYTR